MPRKNEDRAQIPGERRARAGEPRAGLPVRDRDIEPQRGIRYVARLFKGIAVLMLAVMIAQVVIALSDPSDPASGAIAGEAVRLLAFAGLLWGGADLALMFIKSHYDLRATRILMTRQERLLQRLLRAEGDDPSVEARGRILQGGSRGDD